MRKYFGGLFLILAIAMLVPGTALATHSNGQGPGKDFRNGSHKGFCPTPFGTFPCHVHVNGQGPDASGTGGGARGNWWIDITTGGFLGLPDPVSVGGEVVCLHAGGNLGANDAWSRLRIDQSNTPLAPLGFTVQDRATDNGEGSNDPEDGSTGFLNSPGTTCPPIPITVSPIESGNITIHDGI
jgi:hypothetical protein